MSKKWPEKTLQERILWEEPFRELIKLVGYAGMKLSEFRPKVQPIIERYGLEPMKLIGDLILLVEEHEPRYVRLHPNARPLVWPLLGPDSENPPWWTKLAKPATANDADTSADDTKPAKRQRKRASL